MKKLLSILLACLSLSAFSESFDIGLPQSRQDYNQQQQNDAQRQNEEALGSQFLNDPTAPKGSDITSGGKVDAIDGRPNIPYDRTLLMRYENKKAKYQFFYPSPTVALRLETKEVPYRLSVYDTVAAYKAYRKKRKEKGKGDDLIKMFKNNEFLPALAEGNYNTMGDLKYYKTKNLDTAKSEFEAVYFMSNKKLYVIELHGRLGGNDLFLAWQTILGSLQTNYKHVGKEDKLAKSQKYKNNKERYKQEDLEFKELKKKKKLEEKERKKAKQDAKKQAKLDAKAEKEREAAAEKEARKALGYDD